MVMVQSLTVLAGLLCGYALALWAGLCAPDGECLTWGVLAITGGVGALSYEVATLVFDDGTAGRGSAKGGAADGDAQGGETERPVIS